MKPVERSGFVDLYILVQQNSTGTFNQITSSTQPLGNGFYDNLVSAQHAQTIELIKNNRVEIFHLEWPLK